MHIIVEVPNEIDEVKYPILARGKTTGSVVLFTAENVGIVLVEGDSGRPLGYYSERYTGVKEAKSAWEILPTGATVTLTQD